MLRTFIKKLVGVHKRLQQIQEDGLLSSFDKYSGCPINCAYKVITGEPTY